MKKKSILILLLILFLFAGLIIYRNYYDNPTPSVSVITPTSNESALASNANTTEQQIYRLIKTTAVNSDTKNKLLSLIKDIDWVKMNAIDGNAVIETLDWVDRADISKKEDITNLLMAYQGLDGAYAEKYSAIVAKLYVKNMTEFIKSLSALPEENVNSICKYVAYGCSYLNAKEIVIDTKQLLNSKEITIQEKSTTEKLIESFGKSSNQ